MNFLKDYRWKNKGLRQWPQPFYDDLHPGNTPRAVRADEDIGPYGVRGAMVRRLPVEAGEQCSPLHGFCHSGGRLSQKLISVWGSAVGLWCNHICCILEKDLLHCVIMGVFTDRRLFRWLIILESANCGSGLIYPPKHLQRH